jgi:hypothetical protein
MGMALLACLVYWPGLSGGFVFDDSAFIVTNTSLHVQGLRMADWVSAAMSFPSGIHQGRWLGMLSFAVNHYFTGLDPFWLKLTNLGIHVLNGLLVFLLLRAAFALHGACRTADARTRPFDPQLVAAALAGLWLVLPVNLTAVLYVSQRLESLSTTFILLGLWLYLRARLMVWREGRGEHRLWIALLACTGIGVLVKESAAMLPLFAACGEFALARGRTREGGWNRRVQALFAILIGFPFLLGAVWLLTWVGGEHSYARSFTTGERLLTEARVLVEYIHWIILPRPDSLTIYHDDTIISRGLLSPGTTLPSLLALAALFGAALWQRRRRPLLALGIFWFFAGHLLTGTVIPLMLVMEHRNYFPSIGILLAGAALVTLEGGFSRTRLRVIVVCCALAFYGLTTWMRAEEWSDPLRLAVSEATKRPQSSAAQYELGQRYLASIGRDGMPMTEDGFEVLERAASIPDSDILSEQLLITGHAELKRPILPRWWDSLLGKLHERPPTSADVGALDALFRCQLQRICPLDVARLKAAFDAAVAWPQTDGVLLFLHGLFAERLLHDPALAERQLRAAVARAPGEFRTREALIRFLVAQDRQAEARQEMAGLRELNHFGSLSDTIGKLEQLLSASKSRH